MWPPVPSALKPENATYDVASVNLSGISFVTNKAVKVRCCTVFGFGDISELRVQVDASAIVDDHKKAPILGATSALETVVTEWATAGTLLEIDWNRMRTLEFQETLRLRNQVRERLKKFECTLCDNFNDHASPSGQLCPPSGY